MTKEQLALIYVIVLGVMSLITFFAYGLDKLKAKANAWRIPEKVLLGLSVLGGGIGGFLGMKVFRHKTSGEHWYFTAINIVAVVIQIGILVYIFGFMPQELIESII